MGVVAPIVGIIHNAAIFVFGDLIAFHDPFDRGSIADFIVVGLEGYAAEGDFVVIDDRGFVDLAVFASKLHFGDAIIVGFYE